MADFLFGLAPGSKRLCFPSPDVTCACQILYIWVKCDMRAAQIKRWLNPDAPEEVWAGVLLPSGLLTAVLANHWLDDRAAADGPARLLSLLGGHFDLVLQSCRSGHRVPEASMFSRALQQLGVTPQQVDDTVWYVSLHSLHTGTNTCPSGFRLCGWMQRRTVWRQRRPRGWRPSWWAIWTTRSGSWQTSQEFRFRTADHTWTLCLTVLTFMGFHTKGHPALLTGSCWAGWPSSCSHVVLSHCVFQAVGAESPPPSCRPDGVSHGYVTIRVTVTCSTALHLWSPQGFTEDRRRLNPVFSTQ